MSDTATSQWSDGTPRWDDPDPLGGLEEGQEESGQTPDLEEIQEAAASGVSNASPEESQSEPEIRVLREQAKRTDEAEAALPALQRENALLKSGLDFATPIGELFLKGYAGEFTPEALRAEAEKYGIPSKRRSQPQ